MFGISNDTWGLIVVGLLGYFFVRLISQLDKLTHTVSTLNVTMTLSQEKDSARDELLKEHHDAIEKSRSRIHKIRNLLTPILLEAQRAGWKIDIHDIDAEDKA